MAVTPKPFKGRLKSKILLAEDTYDFVFQMDEKLEFEAGQFLYVTVQDGQQPPLRRAYSICSAPYEDDVKLCIKIVPGGRATTWFLQLEEGTEIDFLAPLGHFTFKKDSPREALFIATGTGLAPLMSMITEELKKADKRKMTLLFGVRHEEHLFYENQLKELSKTHTNFTPFITLSRPNNENWQGEKGRVTDWLGKKFLTDFQPDNVDVYICGLGEMVQDVQKLLMEKGTPKEQIYFERYS